MQDLLCQPRVYTYQFMSAQPNQHVVLCSWFTKITIQARIWNKLLASAVLSYMTQCKCAVPRDHPPEQNWQLFARATELAMHHHEN